MSTNALAQGTAGGLQFNAIEPRQRDERKIHKPRGVPGGPINALPGTTFYAGETGGDSRFNRDAAAAEYVRRNEHLSHREVGLMMQKCCNMLGVCTTRSKLLGPGTSMPKRGLL